MNHYDVKIAKKEQQLEDAGYTIIENHGWFYPIFKKKTVSFMAEMNF